MQSIPYELANTFCQLTNKPMTFFVVAIWIYLAVVAYNSESIDELLILLLSPLSKEGFMLSWIAIFLFIPVLLIISLICRLCK